MSQYAAARCANLGPTGYTPYELALCDGGTFVPGIVLADAARGAICALLACASTDSLALDYDLRSNQLS